MTTRAQYCVIGVFLAAAVVAADRVEGFLPRVQMPAYQVRFRGRLGPPRDSDRGTFDLTLAYKGKNFRLQLTELLVLSGGVLSNQLLNAVEPYRPNFFLRARQETMQPLLDARADDVVEMTGYLRGRHLLVSEVRILRN
jgi:hypothetical protein